MILRIAMIPRALGAIFRSYWAHLRNYRVMTTPEEQENRLDECEVCEFLSNDRQCMACFCMIDAKTLLCAESCPKKRWKAIWEKNSLRRS